MVRTNCSKFFTTILSSLSVIIGKGSRSADSSLSSNQIIPADRLLPSRWDLVLEPVFFRLRKLPAVSDLRLARWCGLSKCLVLAALALSNCPAQTDGIVVTVGSGPRYALTTPAGVDSTTVVKAPVPGRVYNTAAAISACVPDATQDCLPVCPKPVAPSLSLLDPNVVAVLQYAQSTIHECNQRVNRAKYLDDVLLDYDFAGVFDEEREHPYYWESNPAKRSALFYAPTVLHQEFTDQAALSSFRTSLQAANLSKPPAGQLQHLVSRVRNAAG